MFANDIRIVTIGTAPTYIKDTLSSGVLMSDKCNVRVDDKNNSIKQHHIHHKHQLEKHTEQLTSNNYITTACTKKTECNSNVINFRNNDNRQEIPNKYFSQHQNINQEKQGYLQNTDSKNKNHYITKNISIKSQNDTAISLVKRNKHNIAAMNSNSNVAYNCTEMISCSQFTPTGHIIQNHQKRSSNEKVFCEHSNQNIVINKQSPTIVDTCSTSSVLVSTNSCYQSSCQNCCEKLAKLRLRSPLKKNHSILKTDQTQEHYQQKVSTYCARTSARTNSGRKLKDFVVVALAARRCNLNGNHSNNISSKRKSFWKNSGNTAINCWEGSKQIDGSGGDRNNTHTTAATTANSPNHTKTSSDKNKKIHPYKSNDLNKLTNFAMTTTLKSTKLPPVPSTTTTSKITQSSSSISLARYVPSTVAETSSPTITNKMKQSGLQDDNQNNDTKVMTSNADSNNNSIGKGSISELKTETSLVNTVNSSNNRRSSSKNGASTPNSYTLDFLHSVGIKMTGRAILAGRKMDNISVPSMTVSLRRNNNRDVSPIRNMYVYNNMLGDQRQQRYEYNSAVSSSSNTNQSSGSRHYQHYHLPPKLTIASFLQKDTFPDSAITTSPCMASNAKYGNCNNYLDQSSRSYSAHYTSQQNHRYNYNYYHQSHYQEHQAKAGNPHSLIYNGSRHHKSNHRNSIRNYIENDTQIFISGDQSYYMAEVIESKNHQRHSRRRNQNSIAPHNSIRSTKPNTSCSMSSCSSSTSSVSSNLSGIQQQGVTKVNVNDKKSSKRQTNSKSKQTSGHNRYAQRNYQYYPHHQNTNNYYRHHRIPNQQEHHYYYQHLQRSSITIANSPAHQNYYKLTHVTHNNNTSNLTECTSSNNSNGGSANNSNQNIKFIDNTSSSPIYVYNSVTTSNYEQQRHHPYQYDAFNQQQSFNHNQKIVAQAPFLPFDVQSSLHMGHEFPQTTQKVCINSITNEDKETKITPNELLEPDLQISTKSISESITMKDNDSDTSSSHSSAILTQYPQKQKCQTTKSESNLYISTSSVASGSHNNNVVSATKLSVPPSHIPCNNDYKLHQHEPQMSDATKTHLVAYTSTVPANQTYRNNVLAIRNVQNQNSSISKVAQTKEHIFESQSSVTHDSQHEYSSVANNNNDEQKPLLNASDVTTINSTNMSSRSTSSSSGYWSPSQHTNAGTTTNFPITIGEGLNELENLHYQTQNSNNSTRNLFDGANTSSNPSSSNSSIGELTETKYCSGFVQSLNQQQQRVASQQHQFPPISVLNASYTGLSNGVRSRISGRNQQLSVGNVTSSYPIPQYTTSSNALVYHEQTVQSTISHNMMDINSAVQARSTNGPSANASLHDFITMHTPPDRFLARAHLVEMKEPPVPLENNTKWDQLSQSIWKKFVSCQQTEETFKQKMYLWRYLYLFIKNSYPRFGLYLVGSTISGFGANSSDVDMCLVSRNNSNIEPRVESLYNLTVLRDSLNKSGEFEQFNLIEAKVPILRFRDRMNQLEVDLNFNNCVGIKNTHLLYCYSQLDWRLRPLVLIVKLWAQYHNINDAKNMTISSYSLVLMVIHFLQYAVNPPVLPCLHKTCPDKFPLLRSNEFGYVDMSESIDPYESKNAQTLGELFLYFLEYYSCFDYTQFAISIRTGGLLPINVCRTAKSLKNDVHQWKELCIEEPFDLTNTARSVYDLQTFERVKSVFATSWQILKDTLDLNAIFSPMIVSISSGVTESNLYTSTKIIVKELTLATTVTASSLCNEQYNDTNNSTTTDKRVSMNYADNVNIINVTTDRILDNIK